MKSHATITSFMAVLIHEYLIQLSRKQPHNTKADLTGHTKIICYDREFKVRICWMNYYDLITIENLN